MRLLGLNRRRRDMFPGELERWDEDRERSSQRGTGRWRSRAGGASRQRRPRRNRSPAEQERRRRAGLQRAQGDSPGSATGAAAEPSRDAGTPGTLAAPGPSPSSSLDRARPHCFSAASSAADTTRLRGSEASGLAFGLPASRRCAAGAAGAAIRTRFSIINFREYPTLLYYFSRIFF